MSHFSNALLAVMEKNGLKPAAISGRTNIPQSSLSRYANGTNRPSPDVVEKFRGALPPADFAALVRAYLRDALPPSMRRLIRSTPLHEPPDLPENLRRAIVDLTSAAVENPSVARALIALH